MNELKNINYIMIQQYRCDFIKNYISSLDVSYDTKQTYKKSVTYFMNWLILNHIENPTREDILSYKAFLFKNYKASTVSSYITGVKSFFSYLESEKIYPNITSGIKGAKSQQGFRKDSLSINQTLRVLNSVDKSTIEGLRDFALVNLLIRTGLRTIEVFRSNVEDIRQEAGEALLYIQGKGRNDKDNFVILTENTLIPLQEYFKVRCNVKQSDPLFVSHGHRNNNKRLTIRSLRRIVKKVFLNAGINDSRITTHSLRHTAVTLSLLGGATIQEAQQLARHKNINTTLIYAHNIERISKAPERKIDSLLSLS